LLALLALLALLMAGWRGGSAAGEGVGNASEWHAG